MAKPSIQNKRIDIQIELRFLMATFMAFFVRVRPDSKHTKPTCIRKTNNAQIKIQVISRFDLITAHVILCWKFDSSCMCEVAQLERTSVNYLSGHFPLTLYFKNRKNSKKQSIVELFLCATLRTVRAPFSAYGSPHSRGRRPSQHQRSSM